MSEDRLIRATKASAPASDLQSRVKTIPKSCASCAFTDGSRLLVNPYDGAIRGRLEPFTNADRSWMDPSDPPQIEPYTAIDAKARRRRQSHRQLRGAYPLFARANGPDPVCPHCSHKGQMDATWPRVFFDLHHVVGIYAAIWLFIAAFTGIMIRFTFRKADLLRDRFSTSSRLRSCIPRLWQVRRPSAWIGPLARREKPFPAIPLRGCFCPWTQKVYYLILMRAPEDTSEAVHSSVSVDQYSGRSGCSGSSGQLGRLSRDSIQPFDSHRRCTGPAHAHPDVAFQFGSRGYGCNGRMLV